MKRTIITANTIPDAWFQCLYAVCTEGRSFQIDQGSYAGQNRLELDWVDIQIKKPYLRDAEGRPLVPVVPEGSNCVAPVDPNYVYDYWKKIMTAEKADNEQYTYGERLCKATFYQLGNNGEAIPHISFNQIEEFIERYKRYGHRNNQCILQIGCPTDLTLEDPPCLRHIDTRIQDGKLHFFPYFRSWDLWGGFPANLAGISVLQEYMAGSIGVDQGQMICTSKGLHVYGYAQQFMEVWVKKEFAGR